ncbi:MAG: hypothetical protein IPM94_03805 [bacterium]|nr:hypothetical protein [bacterium]
MEEPRNDDLEWVKDAERWICQIQGIRQCKIDIDELGKVAGIHVIAAADREPRHVVRDVESLLKARLDLDVYYKKIGVVQIIEPDETAPVAAPPAAPAAVPEAAAAPPTPMEPAAPPPLRMPDVPKPHVVPAPVAARPAVLVEEAAAPRVECAGVGVMIAGASLTATVELARGGAVARIQEAGPNHPGTDQLLVGRAAVRALADLLDEPATLSLADLRETEMAGERLTLVAVDLVEGRRSERFFGSCSQRHGPHQAAVYAVLDALNRRLDLMNFREGGGRASV